MTPQLLEVKTTLPLTLIDRFHPHLRDEQQEAINTGHIHKLEEIELLEPEQLRPLALLSLLLLIIGAIFFSLLNYAGLHPANPLHPGHQRRREPVALDSNQHHRLHPHLTNS